MRKEEKTKLTVKRIIDAGIHEFGKGSFDSVSINTILENHNISKGLFYHNFKSKDDLYLTIVKMTYDDMCALSNYNLNKNIPNEEQTRLILEKRHDYFRKNPLQANIFFNSIFKTPAHLAAQIKEISKEFKASNREFILSLPIRDNVDPNFAADCVLFIQEIFNLYYINQTKNESDFKNVVEKHEEILESLTDIIFHGILKQ